MRLVRFFPVLAWLAFFAWVGLILYLSSLSGKKLEPFMFDILGWDKVAHAAAFAAGAMLLWIALRLSTPLRSTRLLLVTIALISLFGITDEWHQKFSPHRTGADLGDWIADTIGAAAGALVTSSLYARSRSQISPTPRAD